MNKHFFALIVLTALFAVTLTSCNKDDDNKKISGTISGEHASWKEISVSFDYGATWAATTKISKEKFSLKLPIPQAVYLMPLTEDISDEVEISDKSAKIAHATFFARKDNQTAMLALMSYSYSIIGFSMTMVQYMYVDKDVEVSGSYDEDVEIEGLGMLSMKMLLDMKLKKGWNTIVSRTNVLLSGSAITTVAIGEVPSGVTWMAIGNPFVDLKAPINKFKNNNHEQESQNHLSIIFNHFSNCLWTSKQ
jgi:hypothetical protein